MASVDKVIVTNQSALQAKYPTGMAAILAAVNNLIAADAGRCLTTQLVFLDDPTGMAALGAPPVTLATSAAQNKAAVDGVWAALRPSYLLLLGSTDIIPHQTLDQPTGGIAGVNDPDTTFDSDLPYACAAPYSTSAQDFTAPVRSVGRLPDVTGGTDPQDLIGPLTTAATYHSRPAGDYATYLGVTGDSWLESTDLTVESIFPGPDTLQQVPPRAAPWTDALMGLRAQFVNGEGLQGWPVFYGLAARARAVPQEGIALEAAQVAGKLSEGTVIAAECCYGAELYSPAAALSTVGLCNTYLANQAYGYFGSSSTAFGKSDANDWADLICRYFWKRLLAGVPLGQAVLQARQDYLASPGVRDGRDLKTLAQFNLMGDPSLQPVQAAGTAAAPPASTVRRALPARPAAPAKPRVQFKEFRGWVSVRPFAQGTKSERLAPLLLVEGAAYVLRRPESKRLYDPVLHQLDGKAVWVRGVLYGYTFILTEWVPEP
jgi:hypothetical protein